MTISVDELDKMLKKVSSLKTSAQTNSEFGDYDEALNDLDKAINILKPKFRELETAHSEEVKQYEAFRFKLALELADCYGMKGGNHRRKGELESAEEMYKEGSAFEMDYNIPETYNRTNVIVLQLLRDPARHETLLPIIQGARDIVASQVEGKNKNKWWAWADFGLLNLLSVKLEEHGRSSEGSDNQVDYRKIAHDAYVEFKHNGARKQNFESTINVLEKLKGSFERVDGATASLMQKEIDYLKSNMPEY
jgi:tetratricopeptide (TPR) repeat protein